MLVLTRHRFVFIITISIRYIVELTIYATNYFGWELVIKSFIDQRCL